MPSVKQKRVQLMGLLEEQGALQKSLREIPYLSLGETAGIPGSEVLFLQEAAVSAAEEVALIKVLEALPCAFTITDPPEGSSRFGRRRRGEDDVPVVYGLDKVKARILAQAEAQIEAMQGETNAEIAKITTGFTKEADEAYWKYATAGKQAIDQKAQGLADTAALESRKQVLGFKQELMDKTFALALERLSDLSEEKYLKLLVNSTVKAAQTGQERLIFSMRDRGSYGKRVTIAANEALEAMGREGQLTMSEETRPIRGGVILTDGLVDVNCSIEALLEARWRELVIPVAETLFE